MLLASNLDLAAAKPLWEELSAARARPLDVDASNVDRLGGLCLQVLMEARRTWRADGVAFAIANPSQAFIDAVRLMAGDELIAAEDFA